MPTRGPQTNCQQVIDDEQSWFTSYWQLGLGTLGTQAATGNPDGQAIGSWAYVPLATLGTQAATGNPDGQR